MKLQTPESQLKKCFDADPALLYSRGADALIQPVESNRSCRGSAVKGADAY